LTNGDAIKVDPQGFASALADESRAKKSSEFFSRPHRFAVELDPQLAFFASIRPILTVIDGR